MQLVAYGAQDIYLTGNPQITFFKVVYRRHTNFSMESIEQTLSGDSDYGGSATATISRNGDLVYRMWIEHMEDMSQHDGQLIIDNLGAGIVERVELEIGGQIIDTYHDHSLALLSELTDKSDHWGSSGYAYTGSFGQAKQYGELSGKISLKDLTYGMGIGNKTELLDYGYRRDNDNDPGNVNGTLYNNLAPGTQRVDKLLNFFVPMRFWFCKNPGLALPLIALQYHEVKLNIKFNKREMLFGRPQYNTNIVTNQSIPYNSNPINSLWCDYIYLDTDERRRFSQSTHEYLIEQLQFETTNISGDESTVDIDLHFNHPVKEIIWQVRDMSFYRKQNLVGGSIIQETNFDRSTFIESSNTARGDTIRGKYGLKLNGHDRFKIQDYRYFTRWQPCNHHSGNVFNTRVDSIGVYSFALKPEEHQPSGTCNFSRIDNAQLVVRDYSISSENYHFPATLGSNPSNIGFFVYAVNYNVLRIMSGMGGLAYSN